MLSGLSSILTLIYTLSYSCIIVDYLRKFLLNQSKIISVSATMSIIDNYSTLLTAQNISAKQNTYNVMKEKYTDGCEEWDLRHPGKN